MSLTIPSNFMFHSSHLQIQHLLKTQFDFRTIQANAKCKNPKRTAAFSYTDNYRNRHMFSGYEPFSVRKFLTRASSNDEGLSDSMASVSNKKIDALKGSSTSLGDGYVSLFIRMLGLDKDPLDREQAVVALWKYSLGGKQCVDGIMQFYECINLIINLLNSESSSACEAAAGLLRTISSVNAYTYLVAESGAIEEITVFLNRSSLNSEVRVQCLFTLWNLSVDEQHRRKIGNSDLLPLLIKSLDDEDIKVIEAAGGILANLSLTHSSHNLMVEAGVIPKLANLLMHNEGSKVIRKEAKNVLLELAKDEYYKILVREEGLVLVPLIGGTAYKSFRPELHSWPSLPDGTEIEQSSKGPSRFGASELLIGLNIEENKINIEEAKINAIVGRTHQHFLARIGAIEMEDEKEAQSESSRSQGFTLLPWRDGVARLVLILQLVNESAITRAAESIADASTNEHMRISFKEAGAVRQLVRLLDHQNDAVRLAVTHALERLSVSNDVCHLMKAEGALHPLLSCLKKLEISENLMEKTLDVIARILDPSKEMKLKFYDEPVNVSKRGLDTTRNLSGTTRLAGDMGKMNMPEWYTRKDVLDSADVACLVGIMRTASPNLQRKTASILEFAMIIDPSMEKLVSAGIESGLDAVFQLKLFKDVDSEMMDSEQQLETALEIEEAGLAVSAASRLLTKLLDSEQFRLTINPLHLTKLLRRALKSDISLPHKNWVAASLVKLSYISDPNPDLKNPIDMEVTLYETIPRLKEQIKLSFSPEVKKTAVMELNRIVSGGEVDFSRAVAAEGGIFSLVKLIEEGTGGSEVEAGLAILYNLSMDSENHPAMLAAGIVPVLRKIVLTERPSWKQALHLLRNLPNVDVVSSF